MSNNARIYYSHEAEMLAMQHRNVLAMLFLIFGLSIGATLALLFAPLSGKRMRHGISKSMGNGLNSGREVADPIFKRVEQEFDGLKKSIVDHRT